MKGSEGSEGSEGSNQGARMLVTGVLSGIFYGLWAYYVNYGLETAFVSSMVQGVSSAFAGYAMAAFVELTFNRTPKPWRFPISAFVPFGLTLCAYIGIHKLVGTPDILSTIMPNIVIGTPYFFMYCVKLEKSDILKREQVGA